MLYDQEGSYMATCHKGIPMCTLNLSWFFDNRTAQVAFVQQGVDPGLASELMSAQREALQSEANARHSEELDRHLKKWRGEARDHIAHVEQTAANELQQKILQLNEQAAHAVSVQKSAEIQLKSQEQRIHDLNTELHLTRNNVGAANQSYQQASASLNEAYTQIHTYKQKVDQLTQQTMDMQKASDNQRRDFEREIEKLRQEQQKLLGELKSQPRGGTPRPAVDYQHGVGASQPSQPARPAGTGIQQVPAKLSVSDDDADDERSFTAPPGLPPGGPPDDGGDDDDDGPGDDRDDRGRPRGKKDKKDRAEADHVADVGVIHLRLHHLLRVRPLLRVLSLSLHVRNYLERKRLEKMRQATKKSLPGKKEAAAAPKASGAKPTGVCYDFLEGKCTRSSDCKYKHDKSEKGKGGGKKGKSRSKSRAPSRSMSPGSRNQVCKFWKAGTCHRGKDCAVQHPAKPAAASTKDDKSRGKSKHKRRKSRKKKDGRSRSSSRGSNSSKGSQSLKDKGGKPASSGLAAVCLMRALMMVAVINPSTSAHRVTDGITPAPFHNPYHFATPVSRNKTVSFGDSIETFEIPIGQDCQLNPCHSKQRTFNLIRIAKDDRSRKETIEARESDAILAAQMLQSAVVRELHGKICKCNFECDSDIGCRHCIRSDLKAVPGHMPSQQNNASAEIAWIADTGVPFSWTSAAGSGKPTIVPTRTSRVSAVGAESDDEGYDASIADTEGAHELDDFEEACPGELAPLPPAAVTPDFDGGSDAEVEAPEPVDGRLVLPDPQFPSTSSLLVANHGYQDF
eukprot:s4024_g3.t1